MARIAVREPPIKSSPRKRGSSNCLNILGSRLRGNDRTILIQSFPRPSWRRSTQRGQVLLGIVVILAIVFGALFYSFVRPASSTIERDKITAAALALAKDALIGYAAKHATRPGALPCPDIFNTGNDPGLSGNNCQSYIGRLPWKSLGLTDIRDGSGERLWYALSPNFRNRNPPPGPVLNSDTPGQLTVIGASPSTTAIAIIFAPGSTVGTQVRTPADANNVANYLEGENANGDTIFTTAPPSSTFNDNLLLITSDNFFPAVIMRVAKEANQFLSAYYGPPDNNNYFPNANLFTDTSFKCDSSARQGRIPRYISSGCGSQNDWSVSSFPPPWFFDNNWHQVVFYAVSSRCVENASILNKLFCSWGLGDLTASGTGNIRALVIATGRGFTGQTRPCATASDCLEDAENTNGNNIFVNPMPSPVNNDRLAIVSP